MSDVYALAMAKPASGARQHFLEPLLGAQADFMALYIDGVEAPIVSRLEGAFTSETRRRGLLGRSSMPPGLALVIAPCNAIHTFRMQFVIDVIYTARDGRVIKVRPRLEPGRVSGALGAFATIELAAGALDGTDVAPGRVLQIRKRP